jgi:cellulose synthase/poly-beta-1,6-N-acetylglucosamine synthase-like glycosyltransferase
MIYDILHILFLILFVYLCVNIIYLLVFAVAGKLVRRTSYNISPAKKRIAVLIASYDEDAVIVNTAREASYHNYPHQYFDVFIAADHLHPDTINKLKGLNVQVWEMKFEMGSKARSLNFLLNNINEENYDIALVLDGDNIITPGFMEKINAVFQHGFLSAQGHRIAKNRNTPVAVLDALSEEINNHLFRRSQRVMNLSASTIGSGMAFEFKKLKEVYNKPGILDNPACDREVDFEMMKAGIIVEYADDAYLLDEKVSKTKVFENQRRRWLESQIVHLQLFLSKKEHVPHKTKDYWNKLFINLIPPRIIFLAIFFLVFLIWGIGYILQADTTGIAFRWWLILFVIYISVMLLSVPRSLYNWGTAKAIFYLPIIIFSYLKAALGIKMNRREFVHTPKSYIDN